MIEDLKYQDYKLLYPKTVGPIKTVGEITFVRKDGNQTKRKVRQMQMVYFDMNRMPQYELEVSITPCRVL